MSVVSSPQPEPLSDEQLRALYAWIDAIPLSRPKKNMARDFSDGVMLAEVVAAYFPNLVELHNYTAAHSIKQKVYNFETLNQKVLRKLGFLLTRATIEDLVNCRPLAIETVLNSLQLKMAKYKERKVASGNAGGVARQSPGRMHEDEKSEFSPRGGANQMQNRMQVSPNAPRGPPQGQHQGAQQQPTHNQVPISVGHVRSTVEQEMLYEKDMQIQELRETVKILELKVSKLEQLVRLKDSKISKLQQQVR